MVTHAFTSDNAYYMIRIPLCITYGLITIWPLRTFALGIPSPGNILTVSEVMYGASILSCLLSKVVSVVCTPVMASLNSTGH